jgi:hypothetical protein
LEAYICKFFPVSGHQNPWIRIGIQPKMLDPDPYPYQMNTDPQLWIKDNTKFKKATISTSEISLTAAASTMFLMTNFLIALSLGQACNKIQIFCKAIINIQRKRKNKHHKTTKLQGISIQYTAANKRTF